MTTIKSGAQRQAGSRKASALLLLLAFTFTAAAHAEVCTTQAKLAPAVRDSLAASALALATAVQTGDIAKVRSSTVAEYAADFSASEYLIRNTSSKIAGEGLRVASVYGLDATSRKPNATDDADFTCLLAGSTSETDFSISGLPQGNYGFAMVEAAGGTQPWLLAFLLRQESTTWKMAGFYPHSRTAAGHDGLWYWNAARDRAKAKQLWAAWLQYGQADTLLRPANFVTSSHLDKLRTEQRGAAPPELSNGVSNETPLVVVGKGGEFHFTGVNSEGAADGSRVNVMLHLRVDTVGDPVAARARNVAAAAAFVNAHPELRQAFAGVWVFAEAPNQPPFATEHAMASIL